MNGNRSAWSQAVAALAGVGLLVEPGAGEERSGTEGTRVRGRGEIRDNF